MVDSSDSESVDMSPSLPPARRVNNVDQTPLPELPLPGTARGFLWLSTIAFTDKIVKAAGEYAHSKPVKPRGIRKEAVWRTIRLMGGGIEHFNSTHLGLDSRVIGQNTLEGLKSILELCRMQGKLTDDLRDEIEDLSDEITSKITIQPIHESSQVSVLSNPTQSNSQEDHTQLPPTEHRDLQSDLLPPQQYHSTPVHRANHHDLNPKPSCSKATEEYILNASTQPIIGYHGDVDSDVLDGDSDGGESCSDDSADDLTQVQSN